MRSTAFSIFVLGCVVACGDDDDHDRRRRGSESSILFAISQEQDAAGKYTTTSGYSYLELGGKGWSQVRSQEDNECFYEDLAGRLGKSRVDGGIARFRGANLPPSGLVLLANQDGPKLDAMGFDTGDRLTFSVEGYALPRVPELAMQTPATKLEIAAPAPGDLVLRPGADFDVAWTPDPADKGFSTVLVSFETDEPSGHGRDVACFFRNQTKAKVPGTLLQRLVREGETGDVKGTLHIATHSQLNIHAAGGWTIYVVATALHRTQGFVYGRN